MKPLQVIGNLIFIFLASCQVILALDTVQISADDFLKTTFTTKEGLPQNTPSSIIQTQDGYLWIGTFGGLVRFDGLNFSTFTSSNTPEIINNRIRTLYEDKYQNLWIGSEDGDIYCYHQGVFQLIKKSKVETKQNGVHEFFLDQNDNL